MRFTGQSLPALAPDLGWRSAARHGLFVVPRRPEIKTKATGPKRLTMKSGAAAEVRLSNENNNDAMRLLKAAQPCLLASNLYASCAGCCSNGSAGLFRFAACGRFNRLALSNGGFHVPPYSKGLFFAGLVTADLQKLFKVTQDSPAL
jgi:hypothetical protein